MEVKAYQCKYCGGLYKTSANSLKCEYVCEDEILEQHRQKIIENEMKELVHYVRLNAGSVEDICRMSEEVSKKLYGEYYIKKLSLDVRYCEHASNTHSAPIGMKTNWSQIRNSGIPTGYPALVGEITIIYNKQPKGFSDEHFNSYSGIAGICTGTGGYQSSKEGYTCRYSVTLWLEDFPKIKEKIEKAFEVNKIFTEEKNRIVAEYEEKLSQNNYVSGLESDIQSLTEQIEELSFKIQSVRKAKSDAVKKIAWPYKEQIEKLYAKTENGFRVQRPRKEL